MVLAFLRELCGCSQRSPRFEILPGLEQSLLAEIAENCRRERRVLKL